MKTNRAETPVTKVVIVESNSLREDFCLEGESEAGSEGNSLEGGDSFHRNWKARLVM